MDEEKEISKNKINVVVFYDGTFFNKVSNFYLKEHPERRHIHLGGLNGFILSKVSLLENVHISKCQVVDSQRFMGTPDEKHTYTSSELGMIRAREQDFLENKVKTHLSVLINGKEKGVDVNLAIRAAISVITRNIDVFVIITGDGDFKTLPKTFEEFGCKTMLLSWDYDFHPKEGEVSQVRTSQDLLREAHYPFEMYSVIEKGIKENDNLILGLFGRYYFEKHPCSIDSKNRNSGVVIFENGDKVKFHRNNPILGMNFEHIVVGQQYLAGVEKKDGRRQACDFQPVSNKSQAVLMSKGGSQS